MYFDVLFLRFKVLHSNMIIQSCKQTHIIFIHLYFFWGKKKFGSTQALFAKIKFRLSDFGKHQYIAIYACLRDVLVLANHDFYDADS